MKFQKNVLVNRSSDHDDNDDNVDNVDNDDNSDNGENDSLSVPMFRKMFTSCVQKSRG